MLLALVLIRLEREVSRFSFACLTLKIYHLRIMCSKVWVNRKASLMRMAQAVPCFFSEHGA